MIIYLEDPISPSIFHASTPSYRDSTVLRWQNPISSIHFPLNTSNYVFHSHISCVIIIQLDETHIPMGVASRMHPPLPPLPSGPDPIKKKKYLYMLLTVNNSLSNSTPFEC